jgi:elongation factor P
MIPQPSLAHGDDHAGALTASSSSTTSPRKGRAWCMQSSATWRTGNQTLYRFRSDEAADTLSLEQQDMEYLYHSPGEGYVFMNLETYEQMHVQDEALGEDAKFLKENMKVILEFHEHHVIGIELPIAVEPAS